MGFVVTLVIVGGGTKPVPLRLMLKVWLTLPSLLAIWIAAVFAPAAEGVNCTTIVVLPLAAMLLAGEVVTVKFPPLTPSMVTPVMLTALVVLLFLIVKVFAKLPPTFTLP